MAPARNFKPQTFTEEIGAAGVDLTRVYESRGVDFKKSTVCPFHDDRSPSFSILKDGIAWKCFAGCGEGDIVGFVEKADGVSTDTAIETLRKELGLPRSKPTKGDRLAVYEYGEARKVRTYPKDFRWEHRDGDGWRTCRGCRHQRAWYRFPEGAGTVYVTEGEKAADAVASLGLVATSTGGANSFEDEHAALFPEGRHVVILRDNDDAGLSYALKVRAALMPKSASMKILLLPALAMGEDPYDYVVRGGTAGGIEEAANAPDTTAFQAFEQTRAHIARYVVLSPEQLDVEALWVMGTHVFELFDLFPYLSLTAAQKESGKTINLEVLEPVVCRPLLTAGMSEAAFFRSIAKFRPTLLWDEVDSVFDKKSDQTADIRSALHSGYRKRGSIMRCVGEKNDVEAFPTYCPKAFAGVNRIDGMTASRSFTIRLRRRTSAEKIDPVSEATLWPAAQPVREALERWAESVRQTGITLPYGGMNAPSPRAADNMRPLVAIAELAGIRERANASLLALIEEGRKGQEEDDPRNRLLGDIREIMLGSDLHQVASGDLAALLCGLPDSEWRGYNKGEGIKAYQVARLLDPYQIRPDRITVADRGSLKRARGYVLEQFEDAWRRHLGAYEPED